MIPDYLRNLSLRPHPHVVILGAGASYAATPQAELHGRQLPLMAHLPETLELRSVLDSKEYSAAKADFEGYYDSLIRDGRAELSSIIEDRLVLYFNSIQISNKVTLYDRLVLALRRKDVIATFNWDPLLPYAYRRSGHLKALPALLFLHGNIRLGVCRKDHQLGWNDDRCNKCSEELEPAKLLYPVSTKDYTSDIYLSEQWSHLDWFLSNAYFVTIVGYSAPKTDVDARSRMADKLFSNTLRGLLQVEIVDPKADELIKENLGSVVKGTHYGGCFPMTSSWLFVHPRLSCEALFEATMMMKPIVSYSQPDTEDLSELQGWAAEFHAGRAEFAQEGPPWLG
jgi:hypothetical protein